MLTDLFTYLYQLPIHLLFYRRHRRTAGHAQGFCLLKTCATQVEFTLVDRNPSQPFQATGKRIVVATRLRRSKTAGESVLCCWQILLGEGKQALCAENG
ncbi:MAG: hypothetical protein U0350_46080 [Caldilineaceae bacterium]